MSDPWQTFYGVCLATLTAIVTAVGGFVVQYIQRRTQALDQGIKRVAVDDAVAAIDERDRHARVSNKIEEAVALADSATPPRIVVTPADVQAGVARRRASLAAPPSLPPLPLPVTVVSSVPPDAAEPVTLPRPAPLPRDTSREKAPLR